jgi:hypothetical protein
VIRESVGIEPNLFPLSRMAVLENFGLVAEGDFVPFSDMIEITGLIRLGAFFIVETKKGAVLLLEIAGKHQKLAFLPCSEKVKPLQSLFLQRLA